jgi:tetratricopeptide (TPR) repeat protein
MEGDLFYLLSLTRRDSEAAIADLETAAGQGSIEALLPLARRHTALGEFDAGLQQMDLALKAQPDNEDYLAQHDELLLATGQFPSLIETFRIRLQADPLNHHVATTLAGLYDANGQAPHAQTVVDRYVQSVSLDGALVSEETAASRSYFASVRAEWKGDVDRYISIGERTNGRGAFNALVLKGDYVEAAATVDRAVTDPFLHFLLYGLTTKSGGLLALSEVQLSQALSLLLWHKESSRGSVRVRLRRAMRKC